MRILWLSPAPWRTGGYANQTDLFCKRIKKLGHDVRIASTTGNAGALLEWNGVSVYPALGNAAVNYGQCAAFDAAAYHYQHFEADVMIMLSDARTVEPQKWRQISPGLQYANWFPIDCEPMNPVDKVALETCLMPITMSKFGQRMAKAAGLDSIYVPHGVDTKAFRPMDKQAARDKEFGGLGNQFVVGMVQGNGLRKAIPQQIEGFSIFNRKHPDSLLYIHTDLAEQPVEGGVAVAAIAAEFGLKYGENVLYCDQYLNATGLYTQEIMATLFNAFDVTLSATMGEGFGLTIVESQACGTPVIIGDWTSMSELLFAGWKVKREDSTKWITTVGQTWRLADPVAIAKNLERAYYNSKDKDKSNALREQARAGALQYDADLVAEQYWKPALAEIEARLSERG